MLVHEGYMLVHEAGQTSPAHSSSARLRRTIFGLVFGKGGLNLEVLFGRNRKNGEHYFIVCRHSTFSSTVWKSIINEITAIWFYNISILNRLTWKFPFSTFQEMDEIMDGLK